MAEVGQVVEIKNNLAVVRLTRTEACAKCRACIAGMSEKDMFIEAENECKAAVDDWVELILKDNGFYSAVLIMYGIPCIALIVGLLLGYFVLGGLIGSVAPEIVGCVTGILFTVLAFLWIHSKESRWESKKYRPIATRIADESEKNT